MKQLNSLYDICTFTRAANSEGEHRMIAKYIEPIADYEDEYGNFIKHVGGLSAGVIWSCHTDTVHRNTDSTHQRICVDQAQTRLFKEHNDGMPPGADCGTGVWIMLMIAADVPGTYIFHREEEIGGKGSGWIADNKDNWLSNYSSCIAFDRYGNNSIITHQGMERTCSDEFATELGSILAMGHRPDDGGSSQTARTTAGSFRMHQPVCWLHAPALQQRIPRPDLPAAPDRPSVYRGCTSARCTPTVIRRVETWPLYASTFTGLRDSVRDFGESYDLTDAVMEYPDAAAELLRLLSMESDGRLIERIEDVQYDGVHQCRPTLISSNSLFVPTRSTVLELFQNARHYRNAAHCASRRRGPAR